MTPDEVRVGAWFRVETVGGFNYDGRHFSQGEVGIITNRLTVGICTLQAHFSLSLSTSHPRSRSTRCPNC